VAAVKSETGYFTLTRPYLNQRQISETDGKQGL
jgi:hypothetical protein